MAQICQLTGKKAIVGHKVSFSNKKTLRRFSPNLIRKTFIVPETGETITLKISTSALRTVNKKGINACLKEAREKGFVR